MSVWFYIFSTPAVFVFSGLLAMAGLSALLLNVVSLLFATINYWHGKLINWPVGLPVLRERARSASRTHVRFQTFGGLQ